MEYRKENHFIVAYNEEGKLRGKWDILNNTYIGVKGSVLKSKPAAFTYDNICNMNPVFKSAYEFTDFADRWNPFTAKHGKRLEEIISVGLIIPHDWSLWQDFANNHTKLTKDAVQFIIDNYNGEYTRQSISAYSIYKSYKDLLDKCGEQKEWAINVIRSVDKNVPTDFIKGMILRAIHEKVYHTKPDYQMSELINNWYNYITTMKDKLEVKHNILTNYTILCWTYNEFKMAHYDENLQQFNNKEWLYFEDDNYIVTPLLTRADFHKEAERQQNCVERMYMEKVVNGRTHVVTVRKKIDLNTPYITCEVDNNGRIVQYLLRFNSRPTNADDIDFKRKYAEHLASSLK